MQAIKVQTGVNIPGLDPLVMPAAAIHGQFFFKKTGKKLGGAVKLSGIIVKSFGSELLEPCVNKTPFLREPDWFSKTVHEPEEYIGYCGFDSTALDGYLTEKDKHIKLPKIHGRFYMVGPVKLSIYAYLRLEFKGGPTTGEEARAWKLEHGSKTGCKEGGFVGNMMSELYVRLDIGGAASVGIYRARLGLDIKVLNAEVRGTGELLANGFGKEFHMELSALSGAIVAR